jgi:hypothetical protein
VCETAGRSLKRVCFSCIVATLICWLYCTASIVDVCWLLLLMLLLLLLLLLLMLLLVVAAVILTCASEKPAEIEKGTGVFIFPNGNKYGVCTYMSQLVNMLLHLILGMVRLVRF